MNEKFQPDEKFDVDSQEWEARLTAMILGESSDFECDQLLRLMQDNEEIANLHRRLLEVHQFMVEIGNGEFPFDEASWQLSTERRSKLGSILAGDAADSKFGISTAEVSVERTENAGSGSLRWFIRNRNGIIGSATAAMLIVIAGWLVFPAASNRLLVESRDLSTKADSESWVAAGRSSGSAESSGELLQNYRSVEYEDMAVDNSIDGIVDSTEDGGGFDGKMGAVGSETSNGRVSSKDAFKNLSSSLGQLAAPLSKEQVGQSSTSSVDSRGFLDDAAPSVVLPDARSGRYSKESSSSHFGLGGGGGGFPSSNRPGVTNLAVPTPAKPPATETVVSEATLGARAKIESSDGLKQSGTRGVASASNEFGIFPQSSLPVLESNEEYQNKRTDSSLNSPQVGLKLQQESGQENQSATLPSVSEIEEQMLDRFSYRGGADLVLPQTQSGLAGTTSLDTDELRSSQLNGQAGLADLANGAGSSAANDDEESPSRTRPYLSQSGEDRRQQFLDSVYSLNSGEGNLARDDHSKNVFGDGAGEGSDRQANQGQSASSGKQAAEKKVDRGRQPNESKKNQAVASIPDGGTLLLGGIRKTREPTVPSSQWGMAAADADFSREFSAVDKLFGDTTKDAEKRYQSGVRQEVQQSIAGQSKNQFGRFGDLSRRGQKANVPESEGQDFEGMEAATASSKSVQDSLARIAKLNQWQEGEQIPADSLYFSRDTQAEDGQTGQSTVLNRRNTSIGQSPSDMGGQSLLQPEALFGVPAEQGRNPVAPQEGRLDGETQTRAFAVQSVPPASLNEISAAEEAFSTFSLHVSDVSFKLANSSLSQGQWPEASKIRIEEFVNAFDYRDPLPTADEKVACQIEQAIHPFYQQRNLLRTSMRTAATGRPSSVPLRLTLLLDNSGSMDRIDRSQTVLRAVDSLARQLGPADQVTLISFANKPRLLSEKLNGTDANQLVEIIAGLPSEGGTNLETALQLATEKATEQHLEAAQNRIVLFTDGAVNLGDADPQRLAKLVTKMRENQISFDAAGISAQDLNDEVLESLTRQGDGRYYLLDSAESVEDSFAQQIAGALRPAAKNVKIQVEFNPARVGNYKLLGFEKHRLNKEDFRNDTVDAAELTAAEAGVAVYQFETLPEGAGDVGAVSVRFQDLNSGRMVERRWPIPYDPSAPRMEDATPSLKVATASAMLAAKLKGDALASAVELEKLASLISDLPDGQRNQKRVQELSNMIQQARQISGQ